MEIIKDKSMFQLQKDLTYMMPVHFGGNVFSKEYKAQQKATTLMMTFETDRAVLEQYIPEELELLAPEVQVGFTRLSEINWLAGGQYILVAVSAPVRFNGKKDNVDATFPLVVWENLTDPILTGREQTGIPKIFADIGDLHVFQSHYATSISYGGNTFLTMKFVSEGLMTGRDLEQARSDLRSLDNIGWRYIPKVGAPGADLSQFIYFPQWLEVEKVYAGKGTFQWTELSQMQNPRQYHIIKALASLPVKKVIYSALAEGEIFLDTSMSRVLE
ncbi:acetoacetate decarboxylase family protein [Methanospirillum sp.]|uniref:acetoacetate decarboxylase family protein n=1 Tax=Methanospirillum sp. TaxID=45200 RepID=UPI0035A029A2